MYFTLEKWITESPVFQFISRFPPENSPRNHQVADNFSFIIPISVYFTQLLVFKNNLAPFLRYSNKLFV